MNSDYYSVNERSLDTSLWRDDSLCSGPRPNWHYVLVFYLHVDGCVSISVGLFVAKRHVECKHLSVPVTHTRPNKWEATHLNESGLQGKQQHWHLWVLLVFTFLKVLHNKSRKMWKCKIFYFFFQRNQEENYTNIANNAGKVHVPCPVWNTSSVSPGFSPCTNLFLQLFCSNAFSPASSHGRGAVPYVWKAFWQMGCARYLR